MKIILKHIAMWPLGAIVLALTPLWLVLFAFYSVGRFVYEDVLGFDL